jgi:hypothetical protein
VSDVVTTLLDAIGLLLLAAGAAAAVWPWVGATGLGLAGVVVLAGSALSARLQRGDET